MYILIFMNIKTNQPIGTNTMNGMYQRNSNEAFENAKLKGLNNPGEYMYMYSKDGLDYFKNINFRNYINFKQQELMTIDKNILKAVKPIQMFKIFYGKYPNQETIRAVCNINNKQYKEALKIAMNDSNN